MNSPPVESEKPDKQSDVYKGKFLDKERKHLFAVCHAFANYEALALQDTARVERNFHNLSKDDQQLLLEPIDEHIKKLKESIAINQSFLDLVLFPHKDSIASMMRGDDFGCHECLNKDVHVENKRMTHDHNDKITDGIIDQRSGGGMDDITAALAAPCCPHSGGCDGGDGAVDNVLHRERVFRDLCEAAVADQTRETMLENYSRVNSTLRQFVRDWSKQGEEERNQAYQPLLDALERYIPAEKMLEKEGRTPMVLCPGSGLGRLAFECIRRKYSAQGNEFSHFMLLGADLMLNYALPVDCLELRPYVLSLSNRKLMNDNHKKILIPDVAPMEHVSNDARIKFSMCAGEFVEVYDSQAKEWDAVLTPFFIDTAKNAFMYIRTIARCLKPGGLWANTGPLLYHFSVSSDEFSIELSWEEIRSFITQYFAIKEESYQEANYTANKDTMMHVVYDCITFCAIRNNIEVTGVSNPVYHDD